MGSRPPPPVRPPPRLPLLPPPAVLASAAGAAPLPAESLVPPPPRRRRRRPPPSPPPSASAPVAAAAAAAAASDALAAFAGRDGAGRLSPPSAARLAAFLAACTTLRLVTPRTGARVTKTHPTAGTGLPPHSRPGSNSHGCSACSSWK